MELLLSCSGGVYMNLHLIKLCRTKYIHKETPIVHQGKCGKSEQDLWIILM